MSENPAKPSFFNYDAKIEKGLEKAIRPRPLTRRLRDMAGKDFGFNNFPVATEVNVTQNLTGSATNADAVAENDKEWKAVRASHSAANSDRSDFKIEFYQASR